VINSPEGPTEICRPFRASHSESDAHPGLAPWAKLSSPLRGCVGCGYRFQPKTQGSRPGL